VASNKNRKKLLIMTRDDLNCMIDAANCMLAKTSISEAYRKKIESAKAGAKAELHKLDVNDFIVYLDQLTATDKSIEAAYDLQFNISIGGHSITFPFSVRPYNAILDMLKDYYDDEL
jgi:hypothetical protein